MVEFWVVAIIWAVKWLQTNFNLYAYSGCIALNHIYVLYCFETEDKIVSPLIVSIPLR